MTTYDILRRVHIFLKIYYYRNGDFGWTFLVCRVFRLLKLKSERFLDSPGYDLGAASWKMKF